MTEKEFRERVREMHPDSRENLLVGLFKEAGAKFDPEPVELPKLGFFGSLRPSSCIRAQGTALSLTVQQEEEAIRRCNAWPELRRLCHDGNLYGIDWILKGGQ